MTELSGILERVGLPAITRFLSGLGKTGCLELTDRDWQGQIFIQNGRVTAARLGSRTGVDALEAIVEVFPSAEFAFDSNARVTDEPAIRLSHDELLQRMDAVASRSAAGSRRLPLPETVPALLAETASGSEEPLPLDRGTLQTLLAIDGQRSVREVVRQRNSFDALWQLAQLAELGLIDLGPGHRPPPAREPLQAEAEAAVAPTPAPGAPADEVEAVPQEVPGGAVGRCPRLGFEDDPSSSFGRPTRLHRCFATNTPLPLSLDQQRELCLTDQFGTCARLSAAPGAPEAAAPANPSGRIVRLASVSRQPAAGRADPSAASAPAPALAGSGPTPFRGASAVRAASAAAAASAATATEPSSASPWPTPLRARLQRTQTAPSTPSTSSPTPPARSAAVDPPARPRGDTRAAVEAPPKQPEASDTPGGGAPSGASPLNINLGQIRIVPLIGIGLAVVLIGALMYFLAPQVASLFGSDSVDTANLPNARLVAEGTPVAQFASARQANRAEAPGTQQAIGTAAAQAQPPAGEPTPAPQTNPLTQPPASQPAPTPQTNPLTQPADANTSGAQQPVAANATGAQQQPAAQPSDGALAPAAAGTPIFDEHFTTNDVNWPSDPQGAALLTNGTYRIETRQAGQFAAISAPMPNIPADVVIGATFRKLGGPPGGGYGIIVRNQDAGGLDGNTQNGHYYVLEAGDKGEIGIWRRDGEHWVDVLPWQHSDAVKPGTASNDLTVRATGSTLGLTVNGTAVATRTDSSFAAGGAGLFVGGDGNQVAVSHFSIQNP